MDTKRLLSPLSKVRPHGTPSAPVVQRGGPASVNDKGAPGHQAGCGRGELQHGACRIRGMADAVQRPDALSTSAGTPVRARSRVRRHQSRAARTPSGNRRRPYRSGPEASEARRDPLPAQRRARCASDTRPTCLRCVSVGPPWPRQRNLTSKRHPPGTSRTVARPSCASTMPRTTSPRPAATGGVRAPGGRASRCRRRGEGRPRECVRSRRPRRASQHCRNSARRLRPAVGPGAADRVAERVAQDRLQRAPAR